MEAVDERVGWVLKKAWLKVPLGPSDFEALVDEAPEPFEWKPEGMLPPSLALVVWSLSAWLLALVGFRRSERGMRTMG
jgi:hypothetical protein